MSTNNGENNNNNDDNPRSPTERIATLHERIGQLEALFNSPASRRNLSQTIRFGVSIIQVKSSLDLLPEIEATAAVTNDLNQAILDWNNLMESPNDPGAHSIMVDHGVLETARAETLAEVEELERKCDDIERGLSAALAQS